MLQGSNQPTEKRADTFERSLHSFYQQQDIFMSRVSNLSEARQRDSAEGTILLPSSYTEDERVRYGLRELAALEYKFCEADAYESLYSLKMALREISYRVSRYGKDGLGKKNNTRTVAAMKQAHANKRDFAMEYRRAHKALLSLGMDEKTSGLLELKDEDMYRPSVQDALELNSGRNRSGWIWSFTVGGKKPAAWMEDGKLYCLIHDKFSLCC